MKRFFLAVILFLPAAALAQTPVQFSGDFRLRLDGQFREGNLDAPRLQNVRGRYRFRLNADKDIDSQFKVHGQLSTGPQQNPLTNDQDFAGLTTKANIAISEAFVDYHPTSKFSVRGGRMEEVFADTMRFIWDDDIRFNGFHEIYKVGALEFRAGQYLLTNPGAGQRATNLFHGGVLVHHENHQFGFDAHTVRNPNQIQAASVVGISGIGPLSGIGNATTTPNGAVYSAKAFHVARLLYHYNGNFKNTPFYFDFQASRNFGTGNAQDALAGVISVGQVKEGGNVRVLYRYAIKEASSMISQFTDDDLATGTGVNIKGNAIRVDVGVNKFTQWQTLLFIQNPISGNRPGFFVPIPAGANTTYRLQSQIAFSF